MAAEDVPMFGDYSSSDEEVLTEQIEAEDIPVCDGIPRRLWVTKFVTLHGIRGTPVAEGICHNISSDLVLGCDGPLGDTHVAVQISKSLDATEVPDEWRYFVRAWPIELVFCSGASLRDHELRYNHNCRIARLAQPESSRSGRYNSSSRNPPRETSVKSKGLLTQESINAVSSKVCCSRNCVQPFPRDKIRAFRERMYRETTFKFRFHMKLEVHRQVHRDASGKRVATVEGIDVCVAAWRHIAGVSEATFHRFQGYAAEGLQAQPHGNTSLLKPRKHTSQAIATLRCILENSANHMPHRTRTLKTGEKVVSMILPATWKWKNAIPEINASNESFGLKNVSPFLLSRIRKSNFPEFDAKKPGDNFARCSKCDRFHEQRRGAIAGSSQALLWAKKLEVHLAKARAHREVYYANRRRSQTYPHECLTIMHDKMDHAKTASHVFSHKSKELDGLMKLPVSVTGMIAHGHADFRYAHYGLDIFPHDSNYTVGSLAKLLRDFELPPKYSSRELFVESRSAPLFDAVLQGAETCVSSLQVAPVVRLEGIPLPPILNVQMDNAAGDNKNRFVFCFWSLLVAKKIFREVYVNFMLVGHTHDDIDAMFGRWSMLLKKENFPTIPLPMKSFMDVESIPAIPHLVEEVPDFKGFISGYIRDGSEALAGHTKVQQFKFFLDSTVSPVMKYKVLCTDVDWLPKDTNGIKLWREDAEGRSLWPCGEPAPTTHRAMRSLEDIVKGISGFINYWETMCTEDRTGEYRRRYEHLVFYWRAVKAALEVPIEPSIALRDGFWPSTRVDEILEDQYGEDGKLREEFGEDDPYVGELRARPQPSFRVARDVYEGYFLAIRPADGDSRPVWIARALSDPNTNPEQPNCILVQFFRPTSRDPNVQETYIGWDSVKGLRWKIDENQPPLWESTASLMTSWKSKVKKDTRECVLKIPMDQVKIIHDTLVEFPNA
ncbi:hypothetical protein KC19_3G000300 [Ceratodon purpureus]|uniref:DUF7869 domain-containing protein n=1 Tax=Ceratodon purpureus TaxID=3225 RepID=A0A8T0IGM1_CERPU|nr:hypothetical protein KC19_3G000300 [Ceratodon purpureus]